MAALASLNRDDMFNAISKVKYLNLREKLAGTLAITGGVLVSLWTQCVLIVICIQHSDYRFNNGYYIEKMIVTCAQITYFIVVLGGIAGISYGLKNKDRTFFYPWFYTKIFETIVSLVGTILLATYYRYIGLMSVSLICLMAGFYLSLCAWQTIKKMPPPSQDDGEDSEPIPTIVIDEKPPSYDHFTNQA